MGTYLVTGGAGFIGSHIATALIKQGNTVRILDDMSTGRTSNMDAIKDDIEFIKGDICDVPIVQKAMKGVDYAFHQAALASVPRSIDDPSSTNQVNVQGTLNILQAAHENGVKRVVYASSSSVYGDSEELPKLEAMVPSPMSPYAVSKLAGEYYCRVFSDIYGLPTASLRYFNVFGPRQDPNSQYSAVIPLFVKALVEGAPPTIFGDGEQSRDFTYIDNVVNANLLACHSPDPGGKVYNVACGDRFSLNYLYEKLKTIVNVDLEPEYGPPRQGDVKHSQAGIDAIQADLAFEPDVGFQDGLERTVRWYQEAGVE